jgi:OmpA-OmpF porin, OOP family
MNRQTWLGLGLLGAMLPAAAGAQDAKPALSADEIAAMLQQGGGDAGVAYSAGDLAAILEPSSPDTTRGLRPGEGPAAPGTKGSGVVPDLQVRFATNSARVSPEARRQLAALARALQFPQLQDRGFVIAGHTDARGSAQANQLLSQRRAAAVVDYLTHGHAIAPDRLEAVGYGEAQLLDPANPASGKNRRVEVRAE